MGGKIFLFRVHFIGLDEFRATRRRARRLRLFSFAVSIDRNLDDEIFSLPSPRALRELFIRSRHRT